MSQNVLRQTASSRSLDRQQAQALDRIDVQASLTQARINSVADATDVALQRVTNTAMRRRAYELVEPSVAPHAELIMNAGTFRILAELDRQGRTR